MPFLARVILDLFEQPKNSSRDEPSVVFIGEKILEEGILMLLLGVFRDCVLPVTAEHRIGLA